MATTQKKDCDYCRRAGLQIFPVRYAVAYGKTKEQSEALKHLAPLTGLLGEDVTSTKLSNAQYTTRLLHSGYLYVLVLRNTSLRCETVYAVSAEGFLRPTPWDNPQPNDHQPCQPGVCGINASTISIKEAEKVSDIYILYSPVPLSKRLVGDYTKTLHSKAQHFKPKDWMEGKQQQKHTLQVLDWRKTIAEFAALDNPKLLDCFKPNEVLFPFYGGPGKKVDPNEISRQKARLEGLEKKFLCEKNVMTVVVHDVVGITQELNQARNQATNLPIETFLNQPFVGNQLDAKNPKLKPQPQYWSYDPATDKAVIALDKERDALLKEIDQTPMPYGEDPYGKNPYGKDPYGGTLSYYQAKRNALIKKNKEAWDKKPPAEAKITNRDAQRISQMMERLKQLWDAQKNAFTVNALEEELAFYRNRSNIYIAGNSSWDKSQATKRPDQRGYFDTEEAWKSHIKQLELEQKRHRAYQQNKNSQTWKDKYGPLYQEENHRTFMRQCDDAMAAGFKGADDWVNDHLNWLKTGKLQLFLDTWYDTKETAWGIAFADTVGWALSGMGASKQGKAFIKTWAYADKIEQPNLALRGLIYGQTEAQIEASKVLTISTASGINWGRVQEGSATLTGFLDKSHAMVDAIETGAITVPAWLKRTHQAGYFKLTEMMFGFIVAIPVEKAVSPLLRVAASSLGSQFLRNISMEQWFAQSATNQMARNAINEQFRAAQSNVRTNWTATRLGVFVAALESLNLYLKAQALPDGGGKEVAEMSAALLATTAAGLELSACGIDVALSNAAAGSAMEAAGKTAIGGFKLVAGALGGIATVVGVIFTLKAAKQAEENKKFALMYVYNTGAILQSGLGATTVAFGYAASAPFLEWAAKKVVNQRAKGLLNLAARGATWMGRGAALRVLTISCFWLTAASLVVMGVVWFLEDDPLEAWLRRSLWRTKDSKGEPFANPSQELEEMSKGFSGAL